MSEDDSNLGLKVHEDAYRELERERDEWKAKFIKQNKDLGCEMMDPSGTIWDYASATQRENVQLKREVERERALANEAIATWKKTREERDEALSDLEFRRDLFKLQEQQLNDVRAERDRLAEALRELCETLLAEKPRDITDLLNKAGDALAAVKGGSDE
jgi:hypothetical protein